MVQKVIFCSYCGRTQNWANCIVCLVIKYSIFFILLFVIKNIWHAFTISFIFLGLLPNFFWNDANVFPKALNTHKPIHPVKLKEVFSITLIRINNLNKNEVYQV